MRIDFGGIRVRLQLRLERLRLRSALALLNLIRPIVVKLGLQEQKQEFAAQWETHDQELGEKWKSLHRRALFANVGLALSQWAGMEDLLVGIASLLLRTHEGAKIGTILYTIANFNTWLSIISELFVQEPLYITLKPRWDKLSDRLKGLSDTINKLAHHTMYYGDKATTLAGDTSLRPGQFDFRQKSQKSQPLDHDQISKLIDSVDNIVKDLIELLKAMTELLKIENRKKNPPNQLPISTIHRIPDRSTFPKHTETRLDHFRGEFDFIFGRASASGTGTRRMYVRHVANSSA